jgi:hypothetical protein
MFIEEKVVYLIWKSTGDIRRAHSLAVVYPPIHSQYWEIVGFQPSCPLLARGGIHSQKMIEMNWLRSGNPGFLVRFLLYS